MAGSFSPTVAEIDLAAFRQNVGEFRQIASDSLLMAVIKTDAYGHGAVPIGHAAVEAGTDRLGVTSIEEGARLRESGIEVPIHLLSAIFPDQAADAVKYELTASVSSQRFAEAINREAIRVGKKTPVHLKIDTGLHRFGILPEEAVSFCRNTYHLPGLDWEGIYTHFSSADEGDWKATDQQYELFTETARTLKHHGFYFPVHHVGASTITIEREDMHLDMVRPGAALFGYHTAPRQKKLINLRPVMSLKSRIIQIKEVPPNTPIGYGGSYITNRTQKIAIVPIGHGDGYQRSLSNNGEMLVQGKRAEIIGTISLDQAVIDVTDIPNAREEDEVVLIGRQAEEEITAGDVAEWAGSIVDEVLASLMGRIRRVYR